MTRTNIRVKPSGTQWVVTQDGEVVSMHGTKEQAVAAARARGQGHRAARRLAQVVVHLANGQIETEWTYGEDPRRWPG